MKDHDATDWDLVQGAAADAAGARERFARGYQPLVRAYLANRWRTGPLASHLDDAVQEVFLACFKIHGALEGVDRRAPGGFRAYLRGVVRNTARKFEGRYALQRQRHAPGSFDPAQHIHPQTSLSRAFDRRLSRALLRETVQLLESRSPGVSEAAVARVEILRLRFRDGLPIREIAIRLSREPAWVHHQYAKARAEFRRALAEVLARRMSVTRAEIEAQWIHLMDLFG